MTNYLLPPRSSYIWFTIAIVCMSIVATCASVPPMDDPPPVDHFTCFDGTGNIFNATLILPDDNTVDGVLDNMIVAAIDQDGDCVGQVLYVAGQNNAITVWGDDSITPEKDGAAAGSSITLRAYGEFTPEIQTDLPFVYANDGVFVVTSAEFPSGGLVAQLESQIATLQSSLDAATADLTAKDAQLLALQGDLDAANGTITTLTDRINQAVAILAQ